MISRNTFDIAFHQAIRALLTYKIEHERGIDELTLHPSL